MGNILLPTVFLKAYFVVALVFTIMFTIYLIFRNDDNVDLKEPWFCAFKSVGYIILAFLINWQYIKLDKIPILDFFTFVLATLEGAHNFVNSFGLVIASILKPIFRK